MKRERSQIIMKWSTAPRAANGQYRRMRKFDRPLLLVPITLLAGAGWIAGCFTPDDPNGSTLDAGTFDAPTFDGAGLPDATSLPDGSNLPDAADAARADASADGGGVDASDASVDASSDARVDAPIDAAVGGGTFVYLPGGSVLAGWVLQTSGMLTPIDMDPMVAGIQNVATGTNPLSIAAHPNGNFVYTSNYGDSTIGAYSVNAMTGVLTRLDAVVGTAGVQDLPATHGNPAFVAADPQGRVVYTSNDGDNTLSAYTVDTMTGLLTLATTISVATAPRGIAVDPQARYLAVVGTAGALTMCQLDAVTGLPTAVDADTMTAGRQDFAIGGNTASIAFNPAGTYLYGASLGIGALSAFSVDIVTAKVTSIGTTATTGPLNVIVSPTGATAYVSDYSLGRLDPFSIAGNGVPTAIVGTSYAVGAPRSLAFAPAGTRLVAGGDNGTIGVFDWSSATGALTLVGSMVSGPVGSYTFAFAVH